ncbi:unnamed protein product, partial [Ectocarpus sp. 12 AP-2014]
YRRTGRAHSKHTRSSGTGLLIWRVRQGDRSRAALPRAHNWCEPGVLGCRAASRAVAFVPCLRSTNHCGDESRNNFYSDKSEAACLGSHDRHLSADSVAY